MKILVTGADGFIGRNLCQFLLECQDVEVVCFTRADNVINLPFLIEGIDFVIHLAGVNRPKDPSEFQIVNAGFTSLLLAGIENEMQRRRVKIPIIYTSSTQALNKTPYGVSKREAEVMLENFAQSSGVKLYIFRLTNVFGKWCRPNFNSVVATFCYNITRGLPIQINDYNASISLVHIDDVIKHFLDLVFGADPKLDPEGYSTVVPQYETTVGELARLIDGFSRSRETLIIDKVGSHFMRALYSTFVSYLPPELFSYSVPMHSDSRGTFVEMLKTIDSGQFSFFTAHPGVTRGGHYHHTKTEKFLVIKGTALFNFLHVQTGETHSLQTNGTTSEIVETVPGWTHNIVNIGDDELIVILWANELFDRSMPDTYPHPL